MLRLFHMYIQHTTRTYTVFCSLFFRRKVHHIKETHQQSTMAVVEKRDIPIQISRWKTTACWCWLSSIAAISSLKCPLACLMVSGDTPTRVPLCASGCQQAWASPPIPYLYLILMPHIGRMRLDTKEQRQAPKGLVVWIQGGCHLLSKLRDKVQKLSGSISNTLLKRDREVLDWVDWSRVD